MVRFLYIWQLTGTRLADGQDWSGRKWEESSWISVSNWKPRLLCVSRITSGFPCGLAGKESACSARHLGSIPGSGRSPGEGNDNPLQYSCLKNSMDRGDWRATVRRIPKNQTQLKQLMLSLFTHSHADPVLV